MQCQQSSLCVDTMLGWQGPGLVRKSQVCVTKALLSMWGCQCLTWSWSARLALGVMGRSSDIIRCVECTVPNCLEGCASVLAVRQYCSNGT